VAHTASALAKVMVSRSPSAETVVEAPVDFSFFRIAPVACTTRCQTGLPVPRSKASTDWLPVASSHVAR
jgi:hypothetical protein